jgi:hypothetical protein
MDVFSQLLTVISIGVSVPTEITEPCHSTSQFFQYPQTCKAQLSWLPDFSQYFKAGMNGILSKFSSIQNHWQGELDSRTPKYRCEQLHIQIQFRLLIPEFTSSVFWRGKSKCATS